MLRDEKGYKKNTFIFIFIYKWWINQFIFHRSARPSHWPFNFSTFYLKKYRILPFGFIYSFIRIFFHTNIPLYVELWIASVVYSGLCLYMVYGIINKWQIECILINQCWIYIFIHWSLCFLQLAIGYRQGYWGGDMAKYGLDEVSGFSLLFSIGELQLAEWSFAVQLTIIECQTRCGTAGRLIEEFSCQRVCLEVSRKSCSRKFIRIHLQL